MALRLRNLGRRLGQLVWLVPLLAVMQQVDGVPAAEACGGTGPGPEPGWESLDVAGAYGLTRVPVATDGFVLLFGTFNPGETNAAVPLPWIRVTDDAGDVVPGQARVLSTADGQWTEVTLGWQADQPLPIGTVLQLSWAPAYDSMAEGGAGNGPERSKTVELEVVEEPVPLPTPIVTIKQWLDVRHGVGELVDCEADYGCGPFTLQVPTREVRLPGVEVAWKLPDFASMVAWHARAVTSDPRNGLEPDFYRGSWTLARKTTDVVTVGDIGFAEDASDYCVVLIVTDLRTGEEARSEPLCESPGEPGRERSDHDLTSCAEPPTSESRALWCEDRPLDEHCQDDAGSDGGGSGGDGGAGGATNPGQAGPAADVESSAVATRTRPSGGCQLAPTTFSRGVLLATLGALLSLVARRLKRSTIFSS